MLFATAKSYLFFSLFSLISSLEKSRGDLEKSEEWKEKSEEYKKKKAACATFLFVLYSQFRCHGEKVNKIKGLWCFERISSASKIDAVEEVHMNFASLRICEGVSPVCFLSILRRKADEQIPSVEAIASTVRSVEVNIETARSAIMRCLKSIGVVWA